MQQIIKTTVHVPNREKRTIAGLQNRKLTN